MCIAQRGQTLLAAQLSSHFNEPNTYFALFFFFAADQPLRIDLEGDGYYSQVVVQRGANQINNCMAHFQPDKIILLGLLETAQTYLKATLPAEKLVIVNNEEELLRLPFISTKEPVRCKPTQPIQGLAAAKAARRPLIFDENAPELPNRQFNGKSGLVVVENREDIDEVVAINYAAAIDADVAIVAPIDRRELFTMPTRLESWANDRSTPAIKDIRRRVLDRVRGIDFPTYKFATFFTTGLPYGLILENRIPFTHMQNGPMCGVLIANAISEEYIPPLGSALLLSLKEFLHDETDEVAQRLTDSNFVVTPLLKEAANSENFDMYGMHLPYDLLHICSHGGEIDGYFLKKQFTDRDGKEHTMEAFEVVSVRPSLEPDMVSLERKVIFATLDGIPWIDEPLGRYPKHVGEDFWKAVYNDDTDVRTPVDSPIALSCHIKCYESIHQGSFDHLAAYTHPVVFNNSCFSSHELAGTFLYAGARAYLATLWKVGSSDAKAAAVEFYNTVLGGGTLLDSFTVMTASIKTEKYKNIYIYWGLHFSRLQRPTGLTDLPLLQGLIANHQMWLQKLNDSKPGDVQNRIKHNVLFLQYELARRLPPERLRTMVPDGLEEERSPSRPLTPREIVIRKNVKQP